MWERSAKLKKSPARYLLWARWSSYTLRTFSSFASSLFTTFSSVSNPRPGANTSWNTMADTVGLKFCASTSSHWFTIALSLVVFPTKHVPCSLYFSEMYLEMARDSAAHNVQCHDKSSGLFMESHVEQQLRRWESSKQSLHLCHRELHSAWAAWCYIHHRMHTRTVLCALLYESAKQTLSLHIRVFLSAIWINNLIALTWLEHAIISGRSWVESADQRVSTLHPVGLESVQTAAKTIDTFTREEREKTSTKLITRDGQGKKSRNRKRQNILDNNNNKNNNKQSKTLKSHTYACMSKRRSEVA